MLRLSLSSAGKSLGLSPKPQVNQLLFDPLLRPFPASYLVYRLSVSCYEFFVSKDLLWPVSQPLYPKEKFRFFFGEGECDTGLGFLHFMFTYHVVRNYKGLARFKTREGDHNCAFLVILKF